MTEVIVRSAGKPFAEPGDGPGGIMRPTALGMVVGEHVDKIGFFEPGVEILWKEVEADGIRFALKRKGAAGTSLDEIVRGFKIGCFKIAREYGLIRAGDDMPIFAPGFEVVSR